MELAPNSKEKYKSRILSSEEVAIALARQINNPENPFLPFDETPVGNCKFKCATSMLEASVDKNTITIAQKVPIWECQQIKVN